MTKHPRASCSVFSHATSGLKCPSWGLPKIGPQLSFFEYLFKYYFHFLCLISKYCFGHPCGDEECKHLQAISTLPTASNVRRAPMSGAWCMYEGGVTELVELVRFVLTLFRV